MDDDMQVDPLEVLREDLEDESVIVQLEAIQNLQTIALALGPEQSRTKLLTMLEHYCFPVEIQAVRSAETYSNIKSLGAKEEVLRDVALVLNGKMLPLLGGYENSLPMLLLLQKLAMVEETVIREAAVNSIISCAQVLDASYVDQHVLPLITYLSEAEWWTSRVSAAALGPRIFELLKSQKSRETCTEMIQKLCKDEMPMVRQEAYVNIPHMLKPLGSKNVMGLVGFVVPVLKNLSKELQENMRHRIVDVVKVLLEVGSKELDDVCKEYLSVVVNDGNWRVRKRFLDKLMDIAKASTPHFLNNEVLPGFARRLGDAEPSVRVRAILLLPDFLALKNCSSAKVKELITKDVIRTLVKDEFPEVREATSASLLDLFIKIDDNSEATQEEIVDILKQFHTDESGEVRMNFCKGVRKAYTLVGEERFVNRLLPLILKLQEDTKWRVRCGVIENFTILTKLTKNQLIKADQFHKLLLNPFKDPVCAVRNRAINEIKGLVDEMGAQWVLEKIFDDISKNLFNSKSKYLHRIVPIRVSEQLALASTAKDAQKVRQSAVEMMCQGCKDTISNVRLVSAQSLITFLKTANDVGQYNAAIRQALEPLAKDIDDDVKFFGVQALGLVKG